MRRARIKAVANLSSRRSAPKVKQETQDDIQNEEKIFPPDESKEEVPLSNPEASSNDPATSDPMTIEEIPKIIVENCHRENEIASFPNCSSISNLKQVEAINNNVLAEVTQQLEGTKHDSATFKTPTQVPRVTTEENQSTPTGSSQSANFRRIKMAPRLKAVRANVKMPLITNDSNKPSDEALALLPDEIHLPIDMPEQVPDFTSPLTPKVQKDCHDSPAIIINHNIQHPGVPQSPSTFHHHHPFFPHGHSRIRTESLCSIKSARDFTVTNLQSRKNFRTEESNRMIDLKRESRERLSNKNLDRSQLKMIDMIYFNPANNPMKPRGSPTKERQAPKKLDLKQEFVSPATPPKKEPSTPLPVPQLKLGPNGEMILDETSLVVENEQQKQNRIALASTNVVYDDELSGNYGYYKRQQRTKEWSHEETVKFYRCLNTVGTDFSLMLNLFPNRSRRDLKLKFKKEERSNPILIDKALLKHNTFDLEELQRQLDSEEEAKKKAQESKSNSEVKELVKRKILKKQEAREKANQQTKLKIERILGNGDLAINIVDGNLQTEVKENLEISQDKKARFPRKPKNEKMESTTAKEILLSLTDGTFSVPAEETVEKEKNKARKSRKNEDTTSEPPKKRQRKSRKKLDGSPQSIEAPTVNKNDSNTTEVPMEIEQIVVPSQPLPSFENIYLNNSSDTAPLRPKIMPMIELESEQKESIAMLSATRIDDLPFVHAESADKTPTGQTLFYENAGSRIECYMTSGKTSVLIPIPTDTSTVIIQPAPGPTMYHDEQYCGDALSEASSEKSCETVINRDFCVDSVNRIEELESSSFKPSSIKDEIYDSQLATIVCRQNGGLPDNGQSSLDEPFVTKDYSFQAESLSENSRSIELTDQKSNVSSSIIEGLDETQSSKEKVKMIENENEFNPTEQIIQLKADRIFSDNLVSKTNDEESRETDCYDPEAGSSSAHITTCEPSQTIDSDFDEESFFETLDLERLTLVITQIDGKHFYQVHEIDPMTQQESEKPLNLPSHIVDTIVKVLANADDDVGDDE